MKNTSLPKVEEMMTKKVITFDHSFNTVDALEAFNKYRISCAPIVNDKEVIGIVSDIDCMNAIANNSFFDDFRNLAIESIMQKDIKSLKPSMNIYEAESFFKEHKLKHAPVINEKNTMVGILSRRDILIALEKIVKEIGLQKEQKKSVKELTQSELSLYIVTHKS